MKFKLHARQNNQNNCVCALSEIKLIVPLERACLRRLSPPQHLHTLGRMKKQLNTKERSGGVNCNNEISSTFRTSRRLGIICRHWNAPTRPINCTFLAYPWVDYREKNFQITTKDKKYSFISTPVWKAVFKQQGHFRIDKLDDQLLPIQIHLRMFSKHIPIEVFILDIRQI